MHAGVNIGVILLSFSKSSTYRRYLMCTEDKTYDVATGNDAVK